MYKTAVQFRGFDMYKLETTDQIKNKGLAATRITSSSPKKEYIFFLSWHNSDSCFNVTRVPNLDPITRNLH